MLLIKLENNGHFSRVSNQTERQGLKAVTQGPN